VERFGTESHKFIHGSRLGGLCQSSLINNIKPARLPALWKLITWNAHRLHERGGYDTRLSEGLCCDPGYLVGVRKCYTNLV
jgi:hypothetical protein